MPALEPLPEDWTTCLAVVAHPDDIEYGAACAVARWTSQAKRVSYLIATHGEAGIDAMPPRDAAPLREAEQRAAAGLVGVDTVEFLDHPDGLVEYGIPLRRHIAHAIRRHRPEVIVSLTPRLRIGAGVNQADHRAVGLAVLDAARDAANPWLFTDDGQSEPWPGVRMVLFAASPEPTHATDVTDHLPAGVASLRAHDSYLASVGHGFDPQEYLRAQAATAGRRAGCDYAVAFEVVNI